MFIKFLKNNSGTNNYMVEQIKLIYKPKGFDTKYFSNNKSEKDTSKKCAFNFSSSFKKILSNYYERKC